MNRILTLAALLLPTVGLAQEWKLDVSHSNVGFAVDHLVISETTGRFEKFDVKVTSSSAEFTDAVIEATIDVNSVNTQDAKRDGHLKSNEFFDAEKFPTMTFKSSKVEKLADGNLKVYGQLTIRGVTKPVVLMATKRGPVKAFGGERIGLKGTTTINRQEFGVSWNKNLDAGGVMVGDDVRVTINVELFR